MGRAPSKFAGQFDQIELVALGKGGLAYRVLLGMVMAAEADYPAVGGLQGGPTVRALSNVRALDR